MTVKLGNSYIDFLNYILGHPKYNRMSQFRIEGIKTYEKERKKNEFISFLGPKENFGNIFFLKSLTSLYIYIYIYI